jgi:hypothetical protein
MRQISGLLALASVGRDAGYRRRVVPCFPGGALALTGDRSTIYAATFGRGIYKIPVPAG